MGGSFRRCGRAGLGRIFGASVMVICVLLAGTIGGIVLQTGTAEAAPTSWSTVPSPNMSGSSQSVLSGVACVSATNCMAVGRANGSGTPPTLIESWNGTTWSIMPSPTVNGSTMSELLGVACASATNCTAVGEFWSGGTVSTWVESWNGTSWSIVPSPNVSGSTLSSLYGVACVSTSNCTAVGWSADSSSTSALIESWNGTSWSIVPTPSVSGSTDSALQAVACVSASDCTAVGYSWDGSTNSTLVESWNGTSWSIVPSPNVSGSTPSFLTGVACVSATNCTAVGWSTASGDLALVESWNGTSWSIVPSPNVSGSTGSVLEAVACVSASDCTAVGYSLSSGTYSTLVESWNGTSWSIVPSINVNGSSVGVLLGVACVSATDCTAVGHTNNAIVDQTVVETGSRPPAITSASSETMTQGVPDNFTVTTTGLPTPALSEQGALPPGVTFTDNGDGTATLAGTAIAGGIYPITITGSNGIDPNGVQSFSLIVTPVPQSINFTSVAPTSISIGGSPYSPMASATSGLSVAITLDPASTGCTLTSGVVHFTAVGTCLIDGNQAGDSTYSSAPQVQQSITVTPVPPPPPVKHGYDLVGSDGGVFVFGGGFYGSLPGLGIHVNNVTGIVPTATDDGYFLVGSDGGVFAFNAPFANSLPGIGVHVNNIVGIVPTLDDKGYFLVGRDGGVFSFNAPFANSLPGIGVHVNNIVGIAATADDNGYWLVGSDGTVYAFGDAHAYGNAPAGAVGITVTHDGGGYWVVGANGAVTAFGDAVKFGDLPSIGVSVNNIVGIVVSPDSKGYNLFGSDGGVFSFGDAQNQGSLPGLGVRVNNVVGAVPT